MFALLCGSLLLWVVRSEAPALIAQIYPQQETADLRSRSSPPGFKFQPSLTITRFAQNETLSPQMCACHCRSRNSPPRITSFLPSASDCAYILTDDRTLPLPHLHSGVLRRGLSPDGVGGGVPAP